MYVSKIKNEYIKPKKKRLSQGDILEGVNFLVGASGSGRVASLQKVELHYAIVMNQDCDLNSDHIASVQGDEDNPRNVIPSVLLCPAFPAQQFFDGNHIDGVSIDAMKENEMKKVKKNNELKRYHYLRGNSTMGIPELVMDFKHFYTIPRKVAYKIRKQSYVATVNELYREELSQRFSNFLSRIGLPGAI